MTHRFSSGALLVQFALCTLSSLAEAQQSDPAPTQELERVTITGSSIRRVDSETALPVQVITKDEISRSGATNVEQLLSTISAISSMGAVTNDMGAGTSTGGQSAVSLRGLGADRTLVLVNGRRLSPFPGGVNGAVNINTIPIAAIERIEVLKDGASGIYGSDAVAGVVNFIMSKSFRGLELSASAGSPTRSGGGKAKKLGLVGGFGDLDADGYSVVVSAAIERESALFGRDRDFASNGNVYPLYESGATGTGNIEGAWIPGKSLQEVLASGGPPFYTSPSRGYGSPVACSVLGNGMYSRPSSGVPGATVCAYDPSPYVNLLPKRSMEAITANVTIRPTSELELFGDFMLGRSRITQSYQSSPLRASFLETDALFAQRGVDPALLLYADNPNYPTAYLQQIGRADLIGKPLAITLRESVLGNRVNTDTNTQLRATVGANGRVVGQDYEVAVTHNGSKLVGRADSGYFSQVDYVAVINDPVNNRLWNPWSPNGVQAPELADKLRATQYTGQTLNGKASSDLVDAKLTGDAFKLPAGTSQYAVGYQGRYEQYKTEPSAALLGGDISGLGGAILPVDRARAVNAFYGELNMPVVKNLEATLAARRDQYNDVGSSTNFNGSLRWRVSAELMLRASAGTGFRAPTLVDLWSPQVTGASNQFDDPATGQTDLQVTAVSGGNPDLKPEKSRQFLVGLVFSPTRQFSAAVDLFRIRLRDIISLPSVQEVVSGFRRGDPTYAGSVKLSPTNDIQEVRTVLTNTGSADVAGVDLDLSYRENLGIGRLGLNFVGTYMTKFDQVSPGGVTSHKVGRIVDDNGDPVLGAQEGGVVLRWKHQLAASLSAGEWTTTLVQNFYKGYRDGNDLEGNPHRVPSRATYDAQVAYSGIRSMTLAVGVKNIFDSNPPAFIPVSNQFQTGYDASLYDPRSRFVYVNASYRF